MDTFFSVQQIQHFTLQAFLAGGIVLAVILANLYVKSRAAA
jgi:hypothetical protein